MKLTNELKKAESPSKVQKRPKQFGLPDSSIISEWFSQDKQDELRKLSDTRRTKYQKYSVYEVYSRHSKTL